MEMNDDTWHLVKSVPKVMGFIGGTSDKPAPITEREADAILQRVQEGVDKPRPKVLFEPGEVVRVIDGPFNDFNGVVEEVNYEKSRLRVAVSIFGRSTPVELEFGQVEKESRKRERWSDRTRSGAAFAAEARGAGQDHGHPEEASSEPTARRLHPGRGKMAKKIEAYIKLQVPAGQANPSPPVGPALGQHGVNIMEFCKAFNAQTQSMEQGCRSRW